MAGCKTHGEYVAQAKAQHRAIKDTLDYLSNILEEGEVNPQDIKLARAASWQRMGYLASAIFVGFIAAKLSGTTKSAFKLFMAIPVVNIAAREEWFEDNISRYLTLKYSQIKRKST